MRENFGECCCDVGNKKFMNGFVFCYVIKLFYLSKCLITNF